ncbi:MAG TPA: aminotransferase class I/II-fold pyridoxal phosphate-dependent enzyme [Leptospiraceae bacterium]|nr:aminotransferase class I/II-fold pyridoxal phosphate-dependent enzyme [Leptospiraceae bacterium]HMX32868.1 aminotransferase class I/II-fold pyridoxal phosphate-dependent enzyme [Leptospiraceae bacterium]HMY31067.1 aminotransferase class I/II-fold pyridoxal phosphate-dependent enzyme [Leptospiraceae bacterium]HNA05870.1 aminotransferase class I/II-fold pyridoxal phosphate-dependent enzyme [Leptospiraceae bacterium]HNC59454.1 aminotransferase class I/II-fold pyridoxal phosphate-dependent enzym
MNYPQSEHFETNAIRIQSDKTQYREHSVPIYMTSSFTFEDAEQARALFADEMKGNIYTRFSNPNNSEFIEKVAYLEGAEDGIATASGMSAVYTSLAGLLKSGDHILVSRSVFGSTHQILTQIFPRFGIESTYVDINKPETWEENIQKNTKMIFVETPSNPALDLIDLEWLGKLCKKYNLILNVDNCFSTPYIQKPIEYGADLVIHSGTKYMDGQGRVIGGVIVGKKELIQDIRFFARHTGPSLSPMNAWVLSKSLETLAIRMERHSYNAFKLAEFLETEKDVKRVIYPFLPSHPQFNLAKKQMKLGGGIVTFLLEGGIERGRKFLNSLELFSHTANLGDTRTIATHPASTTHSKLSDEERASVGIDAGLIRISVGLEHIEDIIKEIKNALVESKK